MKTRALEEMMGEFVKSGRYVQLPNRSREGRGRKDAQGGKRGGTWKVRAAYKANQAEIPEQVMDLKH